MKWLQNRFLTVGYVALLAVFAVIGCTGKQDPAETLVVCGNHSCGELAMVTTDTSSKGFHYLTPSVSPDGSQVLFTADWNALPADPKEPEDEYYVNFRQMLTIPLEEGYEPRLDLAAQGAELIRLRETSIHVQQTVRSLFGVVNYDKMDPIWQDDLHIIFSMRLTSLGLRMFRADITNKAMATIEPIFLEPSDDSETPFLWEHVAPSLSPDGRWLVFVRSGCQDLGRPATCTDLQLYVLDMTTAAANNGYGAVTFPLTNGYKRLERPRFSPDGRRIVFSSYLDIVGEDGADDIASEIFTMAFDPDEAATGAVELDRDIQRVTFTELAAGDPIDGILNSSPCYSADGRQIYFVSSRRAPATTVHARCIWRVPADGGQDPEVAFFSRFDDVDPYVMASGDLLLSSTFGFPTEMLNRLEEAAYDRIKEDAERAFQEDPVRNPMPSEVELRKKAADERRQLENFEGVMAHLYVFRGI